MGFCTFKDGKEKFIMNERDCLDVIKEYCGEDFYMEVRDYFETTVYETLEKINELAEYIYGVNECIKDSAKELEKRAENYEIEDEDEEVEFRNLVEEIRAKSKDMEGYLSELDDYLYEYI